MPVEMAEDRKDKGQEPVEETVTDFDASVESERDVGDEGKACGASEASQQDLKELVTAQAQQILELENQVKEMTDKALRLQADFDNFRRRTRQDLARSAEQANEKVFLDLLPILDNLERAVGSVPEAEGNSVVSGVKMVLRQMQELLAKWGVEPIPAVGESFDPNVHEAMMQVEAPEETESGTVVEELQRGYTYNGRTLRPSLVNVAQ